MRPSNNHNHNINNSNLRLSSSNSNSNSHEHHNDTSMDSNSDLSADLLASTPVEKCSLNTRRGKNADAPKRQLLTGYIIYASEVRKQVIDKNPNQNFGDISRLVGNEWKALPHDIRSKYDQRALIHNKRVRERAQRDLANPMSAEERLNQSTNGLHTPKMTKRKLAKLAKEQMRQHHLSLVGHGELSVSSPGGPNSPYARNPADSSTASHPNSLSLGYNHHQHHQLPQGHHHHQHLSSSSSSISNSGTTSQSASHHPNGATGAHHSNGLAGAPLTNGQSHHSKTTTAESATQTTFSRFVEPPARKRLVYSDTFRRYIETLQVPNKEALAEETTPDGLPQVAPSTWLGAGLGRHESAEAALWALRDFMLQDAVTMRKSMEPYL